jgi:hypothetical protein
MLGQEILTKTFLSQKWLDKSGFNMDNKRKAISALISAILLTTTIAGILFYYNGIIESKDSQIALLNDEIKNLNDEMINLHSQIANLTGQLSNLRGQITNLTSANLVASLTIKEYPYDEVQPPSAPYNALVIAGSVINSGEGTAYNAGLHVAAFDNATVVINITVPLGDGVFGTDSGSQAYVDKYFSGSSPKLGLLYSGQTASITVLEIFHAGNATDWTVTPVWTNSP